MIAKSWMDLFPCISSLNQGNDFITFLKRQYIPAGKNTAAQYCLSCTARNSTCRNLRRLTAQSSKGLSLRTQPHEVITIGSPPQRPLFIIKTVNSSSFKFKRSIIAVVYCIASNRCITMIKHKTPHLFQCPS